MDFKHEIAKILKKHTGLGIEEIKENLETPPGPEMGDYAFPCFALIKKEKNKPGVIARKLEEKIKQKGIIEKTAASGPYLNFFIKNTEFAKAALKPKPSFKKKGKLMVEFSQPNTHKEFHVGHLRTTFLGDAIVKILRKTGREAIAATYPGDVGTHVAKTLWCLDKYHKNEKQPKNKGRWLGQIYIEASQKLEKNPELKDEVSKVLQELESDKGYFYELWKKTRDWSLKEFKTIYKDLNIKFDKWYYESEVEKEGKKIAKDLLKKGIAEESDGAVIVNLEKYGLGVFVLIKSDGTSLYSTKDLALAKRKFSDYDLSTSIYVVDSRQSLYFQQLFKTLELAGFKKEMVHVPYEIVSTKEGVVSSRKGNAYLYEDLKRRMVEKIAAETKARHKNWKKEKVSKNADILANAALKFGMLKYDNNKEITFDEEEWLSLEGETGPYVLYVDARISSILKKVSKTAKPNPEKLTEPEETALSKKILEFRSVIIRASENYKPHLVTRYLLELSQLFNTFYHKHQVLQSEKPVRSARVALVKKVRETIREGLKLLGIETVGEM